MERTIYELTKQHPTDEGEIVVVGKYKTLEEAQKEMGKITDVHAQIERFRQIYRHPPAGKEWKKEEYAWERDYDSAEFVGDNAAK